MLPPSCPSWNPHCPSGAPTVHCQHTGALAHSGALKPRAPLPATAPSPASWPAPTLPSARAFPLLLAPDWCYCGLSLAAVFLVWAELLCHPHSCVRATLRALISCHSCPAQLTVTVLVFWLMSFKSGSRPASELLPGVRWGCSGGCPGQRGRCPRSVLGLWVGLKREQFSLACWPCACTVWRGCHLS